MKLEPTSDLTDFYNNVEDLPLLETRRNHNLGLKNAQENGDEKGIIVAEHHLRFINKVAVMRCLLNTAVDLEEEYPNGWV
jgi:hypothetical protein